MICPMVLLCVKKSDAEITGKESDYEQFFIKVLEWQMLDKIKKYNKDE